MERRVTLVLASSSPRRREILESAGIPFVIRPPEGVDETPLNGEAPDRYVIRLAVEKADATSRERDEVVLAADTSVILADEILGKPSDPADAARMLNRIQGRPHLVLTGICLAGDGFKIADLSRTTVWFSPLTPAEIDEYVESGEPMDKAGAYGIQGLASRFVERIDGCYFNVMGLPISLVYRHLTSLGV